MTMSNKSGFAAAAAFAALLVGTQAQAHAKLVSSTPTADAIIAAPKEITLKFSEKLAPKFSGVEVGMPGMSTPVKVSVAKDGVTLVATPTEPLMAGAYKVTWHAVTTDTHRTTGTFNFTIH